MEEPEERCTVLRTGSAGHHRITALDNRVVVEGETGLGPGAGAGEAPWLFTARSPKTCRSFFYSPFLPCSRDYFRAPSPRRCRTRRKVRSHRAAGNAQSGETWQRGPPLVQCGRRDGQQQLDVNVFLNDGELMVGGIPH